MRRALAAEYIGVAYEELGELGCSYLPPGGGAAVEGLTLMVEQPDATVGFEGSAVASSRTVNVRAGDLTPEEGGTFTVPIRDARETVIGSEALQVVGTPQQPDDQRLEWRCTVAKVG